MDTTYIVLIVTLGFFAAVSAVLFRLSRQQAKKLADLKSNPQKKRRN